LFGLNYLARAFSVLWVMIVKTLSFNYDRYLLLLTCFDFLSQPF